MTPAPSIINTYPYPTCDCCGASGVVLYRDLEDGLFKAPGFWNIKKCSNRQCGSLWLDPMPTKADIGQAYRNYYTHTDVTRPQKWYERVYNLIRQGYLALKYGYDSHTTPLWKKCAGLIVFLYPPRRAVLDFSVMYLPQQPKGRLLEIGCGAGQMLKYMEGLQWQVEGVDFDPVAAANARAKGLTVHTGVLEDLRFKDESFDAVIASHVVEHIHEPLPFLQECLRILKPGGKLILVTPNIDSLGHRLYKRNWRGLEPPRHLHLFGVSSLRRLAEAARFKRISAWTTIRDANNLLTASRFLEQRQYQQIGKPRSLSIRLWATGFQMMEWLILRVAKNSGEEMVLVGEK